MTVRSRQNEPALFESLLAREAAAGDEITGDNPISGKTSLTLHETFAVVVFTSIALYNVVELTCIIFTTFKKRKGLYFISFCAATWGIPPYSIAFLLLGLDFYPGTGIYGYVTMIVVGWVCTVTGQSLVLYSRLHLVDRDCRHLRWVLAMIIVNGIILHSTTTVLVFGANSTENPSPFYRPYSIMEKVQVTVFFVQELTISSLYIWATINFFRHSALHAESTRARMRWQLIIVNIVVILLDITILGLEYANFYKLQTAYKAMSYSIKLKLEFSILNGLVNITREHGYGSATGGGADYIFDGSRRSDGPSNPSMTLNTVSSGGVRSEGSGKKSSHQAVAEYFACARRATKGSVPPIEEGVIMRTTDTRIIHHDANERPLGALGGTTTETNGGRSVDVTTMSEPRSEGKIETS